MFWPPKISILSLISFTASNDEQLDTITSLILLMLTMLPSLMSDQLQADSVLQSFNAFAAPRTGLKVIVVQDKTPRRG